MNYEHLFFEFRDFMLHAQHSSTVEITCSIKKFFRGRFNSSHTVLCSGDEGNEFLTDVLVTNFDPKNAIAPRTLDVVVDDSTVYLAVESELGGTGGSSAYGVMKNVVEDYLKLLVIDAPYRVMVFTSLPYSGEGNHVERRVEALRTIYRNSRRCGPGILLIHLHGHQPISSQVQAVVDNNSIRGFIINSNGSMASELAAQHI